ncbi:MAG: hypothetical protein IIA62_09140 [Nitrospinae bacterium]|nr:hypothetical protein [Nitrospinota bacterium]
MASLVIRNIEEDLKECLRIHAAHHGRSMGEEVRIIVRWVIKGETPHKNLADLAQDLFGKDGVQLDPHTSKSSGGHWWR